MISSKKLPKTNMPKIIPINVFRFALPLGNPTGMAWAIGVTIARELTATRRLTRLRLVGIGVKRGARAGIALMRPTFRSPEAAQMQRESFGQFLLRSLTPNLALKVQNAVFGLLE